MRPAYKTSLGSSLEGPVLYTRDTISRAREAVKRLIETYRGSIKREDFVALYTGSVYRDLFIVLIATILSQNTSDRNALRAFENLEKRLGREISPEKILGLGPEALSEIIRPAGMQRRRAQTITEVSRYFVSHRDAIEKMVSSRDCVSLRERLLEIRGVGEKTVDVALLVVLGCPLFPVDTHITRISRRLGLVDERSGYREISAIWSSVVDERDYLYVHIVLIHHGRTICRARRPLCDSCVLNDICLYREKTVSPVTNTFTQRSR